MSASFSSASNALLSAIPLVRSLYSRYFSTMGAISACALAVFWYLAESLTISGDASAFVSSSYRASIWSNRSNIEFSVLSSQLQILRSQFRSQSQQIPPQLDEMILFVFCWELRTGN